MYHRYGRHGPHAWKRWRQRKFQQRLPILAPSVAVVHVHVPIEAERIIIIIMQQPQDFDERDEETTPPAISFPDSRLIGPSQDERSKVHLLIKEKAEFEANTRYDSDIQSVLDRGEEWPSEKTIEREASTKANVALRPYVGTGLDIEAEKRSYIRYYLEKYSARYEVDTGNGTLPNAETKRVQHLAEQDALTDKQDNIILQEPELTYQAIIHLQEEFNYQSRASSGYLAHILNHLPQYKSAYKDERDRKEERDRQPRSGPFPSGGWQTPGTRYP